MCTSQTTFTQKSQLMSAFNKHSQHTNGYQAASVVTTIKASKQHTSWLHLQSFHDSTLIHSAPSTTLYFPDDSDLTLSWLHQWSHSVLLYIIYCSNIFTVMVHQTSLETPVLYQYKMASTANSNLLSEQQSSPYIVASFTQLHYTNRKQLITFLWLWVLLQTCLPQSTSTLISWCTYTDFVKTYCLPHFPHTFNLDILSSISQHVWFCKDDTTSSSLQISFCTTSPQTTLTSQTLRVLWLLTF